MRLAIVTASIDLGRAMDCLHSWWTRSSGFPSTYVVLQAGEANPRGWGKPIRTGLDADLFQVYYTPEILGVVPAFALGVQKALEDGADVIACLHDDLEIGRKGWDADVCGWLDANPACGLVGFGGARGLGSDDLYRTPYNPMQLARQDFVSNMLHAEAHGRRASTSADPTFGYVQPERVACLDGFSQIGRREFWRGQPGPHSRKDAGGYLVGGRPVNLFQLMAAWGMIHHAYDAALGALAARLGWEVWMLPVACHHYGGRTAVADDRYTSWALKRFTTRDWTGTKDVEGDAACWTTAHRIVYDQCRDVLPIRVI